MTLDDCEKIFDQAISSKSESAFRDAIEPFWTEYEILSLQMGRGTIFWRARIIENEVFSNLSSLDYPPPEVAKQGRMNDPGTPCFYISTHKETALSEIGAIDGQLIQLAGFRVTNESPIRFAVIGEYANVYKSGYMYFAGRDPDMAISKILNAMPRNEALKKLYIDKFFASVLANPDAAENGYMFSRALAKSVYSRIPADGIVFPSVKDRGGFNIAVQAGPSDRSFHNVCCLVVRIEKIRQYSLIEFSIVKSADRLDEDWNFVWKPNSDGETIGLYNLTKEEFEAATRHDDPRNALLNMLHLNTKQR
jgi:hypothetical protein